MNTTKQRIHLIGIGGTVMHHLAVALQNKGYIVTGSDDEIFEPSKSRLQKANLLPQEGWFAEKITKEITTVIFGSNITANNPELIKAKELGLKIFSYPEYIYQESIDKQRVVITGSHGKTSIAFMVLHVLKFFKKKFDYTVEGQLEGFDLMVKLSDDAPVIIIEGNENFTSPFDHTPKFLHYRHHIGLISGISWDHINVYPSYDEYVKQFEIFADSSPKGGMLIFNKNDGLVDMICSKEREDVQTQEYSALKNETEKGLTYLINGSQKVPLQVFGKNNMKNLSAAKAVCLRIGITEEMFYEAIQTYKGPEDRLELIGKKGNVNIYKDFAHTPSKLKAITNAVKKEYPASELIAVLELHTMSSLNTEFLSQYKDTLKSADEPVVYFDPNTLQKSSAISGEDVKNAFGDSKLQVFTQAEKLKEFLLKKKWENRNLLLMSSGNFGGININELARKIVG
jgi:UDP-N-acetylmuramate: L-alanyl-gamma-D-glutamyl-meso-diaminopimelate ligase